MKKRFTRILAALALLVGLTIPMGMWGQTRVEESLIALTFPDDNSSNNGLTQNQYLSTWTAMIDDYSWSISNFNNNNWNGDWTYIKCGRKNNVSVANITTSDAYPEAVTKVSITIDAITTSKVNSITLFISSDGSSWTSAGNYTKSTGVQTVTLANPTADQYYKIEFDCQSGSSNGLVTVSKVEYFYDNPSGTLTCEAPTFNPAAGTYTEAQNVTISCATEGATIYYTTNGDEPTTSSTVYAAPISVSSNMTIKAIAAKSGYDNSTVASADYNFVTIEHAGTEADPYTVADARNAIDANTGVTGVYATGIVTRNTYFNQTNGYISYYISDDGNNTMELEAYNGLNIGGEPFESQEDIQVGDIVVIYGNLKKHNTTYEFDAENQLVSLERPQSTAHVIAEGTLTHVSISGLWDDNLDDINLGDEVEENTEVFFTLAVDEGYTLDPESVSVLDASNNEVQLTENTGNWSFYMPNSSVTINATATQGSVPPVTGDKYVKVTSTTDLTSGQYLIVYEEDGLAFDGSLEILDAVGNTISVIISNNEIAVTETTEDAEFTIDMTAGTIKSASGYYIGQTSDANGLKTSTTDGYENAISIGDDGAIIVSSSAHLRYNSASNQTRFRYYKSTSYTGQKAIQLYKKVEATPAGPSITVNGYGDTDGGYVLLAWPESTSPANIEGMISDDYGAQLTPETPGTYDLYYYDESQEKEWRNYRTNSFNLVPGKGYLYASKEGVTLTYEGEANPDFEDVDNLPYTENDLVKSIYLAGNSKTNEQTFYVYNSELAKQTFNYLTMNEDGNGFISGQGAAYTAPAMTGFFVQAPGAGMTLSTANLEDVVNVSSLNINVLRDRGSVIDNAIVSFSNGSMMDKFYLKNNTTRVYIPQGNREMAIANSAAEAEMPVSFRASENGTYTLAVEAENVEMNYLHLIDNLTGMDVDLLQTPSYTFEAKTSDYASRFRLVFKANDTNENNAETFAYFNGTNWTVSNVGEATLQVVDVTGRTVANQMINGNAELNLNQPAGVYVIRLVNGDNVKTQKVVVR